MFKNVDIDGNGSLDIDEFIVGITRRMLLRSVTKACVNTIEFTIPDTYDTTKSTNDNYKSDDMLFFGEYADIRETRDYNYHVNYTKERQLWQNAVIQSVVNRSQPQAHTLIILFSLSLSLLLSLVLFA